MKGWDCICVFLAWTSWFHRRICFDLHAAESACLVVRRLALMQQTVDVVGVDNSLARVRRTKIRYLPSEFSDDGDIEIRRLDLLRERPQCLN